ncbi:glucuronate isomerase [Herbinix hemicellulosilytica]|uniref:Uronate isomerase n=1 Tax=Herbinix hemicellulosilytica TaxID=1564487 RepID=A0A0H5SFR5_HERHM|nr:glucuronate isomerase [Herbinix hemicellulosilytica]RBP60617.1 glucuronate isomerase [Herbinix hemicellulosilytica]CRZ34304.1 Uronate isomerase [Herbinix hemicellulosilytica]
MKPFMDQDFLLSTETAKTLYHEFAKNMPIVDYHCHISPKEIAEDVRFENITRLWLGGDHYKWRLMRANGISEYYITGDAPDKEKFEKWAQTLELAIGNPIYHWSHLELKRYFGYDGILNSETADEVWELCNEKLKNPDLSARGIIKKSNVTVLCTTDDPVDSLEYHISLSKDQTFETKVLPAFRPDEAVNIEKPGYKAYLEKLSAVSNVKIDSFAALCEALKKRMEFFNNVGCKTADHGLDFVMYYPAGEEEIDKIMERRLEGEVLTEEEILKFKTALLLFLGREYNRLNWVMQLHYGVKRDNNTRMYKIIGPNTGYDCINNSRNSSAQLADFLNALDMTDELPKTIVYSLNPVDNAAIDTVIGCFQNDSAIGKLQHGSAWWFNDNEIGMRDHLTTVCSLGMISNFVGMLTDSRSFLSYTRHEYFRRILCDVFGTMVESGRFPKDMRVLKKLVEDISYNNCMKYFGFDKL